MIFSQRHYPSPPLTKEKLPGSLIVGIWNAFYTAYFIEGSNNFLKFTNSLIEHLRSEIFNEAINIKLFNPIDSLYCKYLSLDYPKFYDFPESIVSFRSKDKLNFQRIGESITERNYIFYRKNRFIEKCNEVLEKEKAQYRFVNGLITPITNQEEIGEIEKAAKTTEAGRHINTAIQLYKDRENPDYRNSIKESISAVEATYRQMTSKKLANIGVAITEMEKIGMKLPESLKNGFTAIYGWTSSEAGIRHALMNGECKLNEAEARLMLVMCSAYVNYLLSLKDRDSNK